MTANDERTYIVPSLLKLSYHACNKLQRDKFHELPGAKFTRGIDLQGCCESLLMVIKQNSKRGVFDPLGDRRDIFSKVHLAIHNNLSENICEIAAFYGHIDCLAFAKEIGVHWYSKVVFLRTLMGLNSVCNDNCIAIPNAASKNGHLDCLKYAHENGCPWDESTCSVAAQGGHLDILRYAYENGCPWNKYTCYAAAKGGHLDILRYAHENGCPWDEDTCFWAAGEGHLDCLRYAHENGCPWDEDTCFMAASLGHLDCLRYAHENGCPWNEFIYFRAIEGNGCLKCFRYAYENGCPIDNIALQKLQSVIVSENWTILSSETDSLSIS